MVKYLDIPIQHVNDGILRRMRRPETAAGIRALFQKLREKIDGVVLRTSLIVGLPGEGEAEFNELLDFLREQRLPRAGVFTYSPQEGTDAAEMPDRCSADEAEARRRTVMELQCRIMDDYDQQQIGKTFQVLCEGQEDGFWYGRRYADSPDIDEVVVFSGDAVPGEFAQVQITDFQDGRLIGEVI